MNNCQNSSTVTPCNTPEKKIVICDPDFADIIPGYLERKVNDCRLIRQYIKDGNYVEIERLGHGFKGSGGSYGFLPITDIGRVIEHAAAMKDRLTLLDQVHLLEEYLATIEVRYV